MIVRNLRRAPSRPSRSGLLPVVQFNIEPAPGIVIYDVVIERSTDGRYFLFTPKSPWGAPTSSMSPEVRSQIISLAMDAYADDQHQHAA